MSWSDSFDSVDKMSSLTNGIRNLKSSCETLAPVQKVECTKLEIIKFYFVIWHKEKVSFS